MAKTSTSGQSRQQIHDVVFKAAMQDMAVVVELLLEFVDQEILELLDIDSIESAQSILVDLGLHLHEADALFKVRRLDRSDEHMFVLFEHKSSMDKSAIEQVYRYMVLIRDRECKKRGANGFKAAVLVVMIYHGADIYKGPQNMEALAADDPIMQTMIGQGPAFIDVRRMPDAVMLKRPLSGLLLSALKYAGKSSLVGWVQACFERSKFHMKSHVNFLNAVLNYVFRVMPKSDKNTERLRQLAVFVNKVVA